MQLILTLKSCFFQPYRWVSLLGCLWLALSAAPVVAAPAHMGLTAPPAQAGVAVPTTQLPVVVPLEATTIALHTHTATIQLVDTGNGLALQLEAAYRLDNQQDNGAIVVIKISGAPAEEVSQAEVELTANGGAVALFWTDGVGYTAQVQVGANGQTNLQFTYTIALVSAAITSIDYDLAGLATWAGVPSVGVTATVPATIRQASWLRVVPSDWRYADSASGELSIRWLYDASLPPEPFQLAFVSPAEWQQISALTDAAQSDGTRYRELGELYAQLLTATPDTPVYAATRERFYAQALAAYTTGLETLTGAGAGDSAAVAALYVGLATLYRGQVAQADGTVNTTYAQALVAAARQALAQLPGDAAGRDQLTQWLADGLQVLLGQAQRDEAWPQALTLVEELATLPPAVVDQATLAQTKRSITVRQALELVEQDNRAAAVALAGDEIADATLLPPPQTRTLFQRWEITTTILPQQVRVELTGIPLPDQHAAAATAVTDLTTRLQGSAAPQVTVAQQTLMVAGGQLADRVTVEAPTSTAFAALAALVPAGSEWALVATLLNQLQPIVEMESAWLQPQIRLSQSLDLRSAGELWQGEANRLATEATALEAEAATLNPRDPSQAEQALKARIQAANYRSTAQNWQRLARDSWVAVELAASPAPGAQARTTLLTTTSPAQLLTWQSTPSQVGLLLATLLSGLFGLLLLSGVLWWLL